MGKGSVSEINPMSLGVVGYFMGEGSRTHALRHLVEGADTILLVGNRTNQNGTDSWKLYPKAARYIHIDIDPLEIGRNYEAVRLLGDAKRTLAALAIAMKDTGLHKRALARPKVEQEIKKGVDEWRHLVRRVSTADQDPIRPERVMSEIQKYLEPASIVVSDASYSSIWTANYLTSLAGGSRFISPRGIAGLGWGLPMAIGAKLARRAERVVCVAGDGGFAHSWSELETLVRLELPVVVVVLNNQILGFQKDAEDVMFGEHTDACYFKPVDHAAIARACGCTGYRVEQASELASAMRQAFAQTGPVLLDILTDSSAQPPLTFYGGEFPSPF